MRDIGLFEAISIRAKAARLVMRETSGHEFEGTDEELIDRAEKGHPRLVRALKIADGIIRMTEEAHFPIASKTKGIASGWE